MARRAATTSSGARAPTTRTSPTASPSSGADPSSDWPGGCLLHSCDSRGIFRATEWAAEEGKWRLWRDQPGFSMRCVYRLRADGDTMALDCELSRDGTTWEWDLQATYRGVGRR